jgi:hypothetical protein
MDMPHAVIIVVEAVTVDLVYIYRGGYHQHHVEHHHPHHIHTIHEPSKKNIGVPHQNTWNMIHITRSVVKVHTNPALIVFVVSSVCKKPGVSQ